MITAIGIAWMVVILGLYLIVYLGSVYGDAMISTFRRIPMDGAAYVQLVHLQDSITKVRQVSEDNFIISADPRTATHRKLVAPFILMESIGLLITIIGMFI